MTKPKIKPIKVGPFRVAPFVRDGALTGKWLIDLPPHTSPNGKRARLYLDSKTAATAEAKRLLRELQLDGVIKGYGPAPVGISFSELSKRWIEEQSDRVLTNKKRKISLETHAFRLKALLGQLGTKDIAALTAHDIVCYQKFRLEDGRSPATINSETRLFRQIMSWATDHQLLARQIKIEPIPEPRKRLSVPTIEEVLRIIEALPPRTGLLVRFLAETGCRKGEAFALQWSDIDPTNSLVMIRRKEGWTPKTESSDRDVPIGPRLVQALQDSHKEAKKVALTKGVQLSQYVFPGRKGVKITDIDKALATAVLKAGVLRDGSPMRLTPHMLRKAHATWQKERGVADTLLQPRLGHAPGSGVTARHYVHHSADALRATVIDLNQERRTRAGKRGNRTSSTA